MNLFLACDYLHSLSPPRRVVSRIYGSVHCSGTSEHLHYK